MVHVLEPHARDFKAVTNRLLGKPAQCLMRLKRSSSDRGDQSAVFDYGRRSIAVIRVDSENVHRESSR